jgi:hypothetical protein
MAKHYDNEEKTIKVECSNCGHENIVEVRAEVEVESYLTIKEN